MKDTTLSESPSLNWWNSSKNRGDTLDFILYKHNIPLMNFELGFGHVPRHALILMGGKVFQLFFSDKNSWHLLASWSHKGLSYLSSVQDTCQCSYSSYVKNPTVMLFRNTLQSPWILTVSVTVGFALNCKEHLLSAEIWEGCGFWAQRLPVPLLPLARRSYSPLPL